MTISSGDADWIINSEKVLIGPFQWKRILKNFDNKSSSGGVPWESVKQYDLLSDVTIDDGQPRGLRFRASVFPRRVNSATFQLECAYDPPRGKSTLPLYRFEWNPISGHQNALDFPIDGLAGRTFYPGETHEHSCLDHLSGNGAVKSGGVHGARPILLDASNFHDALTYVCVRIHMIGGDQIGNPEEQWQLV